MTYIDEPSSSLGESQPRSLIDRIVGVFTSPRATMENIVAFPTWLPPLILIAVVSAVAAFSLKDVIIDTQLEKMQSDPNMTAEQLEKITPVLEKSVPITTVAMGLLGTPLFYAIAAGVLLFVGNFILGGSASFKTLFSVISWSGLINVIGAAVNTPVMISRGVMEGAASLAVLMPPDESKSLLYFFLTQIDLFMIWWLLVVGFGFAAAYKFTTKKSMTTVFVLWGIILVIAVSVKAMFS